jgi:hypothetical protein
MRTCSIFVRFGFATAAWLMGVIGCGGGNNLGLICADTFVDFEVSGRIVDSSGGAVAGASVVGVLLENGQAVWIEDADTPAADGSFSMLISPLVGACAYPAPDLSEHVRFPDAIHLRMRYGGCIREVIVPISRENISGSFPQFQIELPEAITVPDC